MLTQPATPELIESWKNTFAQYKPACGRTGSPVRR